MLRISANQSNWTDPDLALIHDFLARESDVYRRERDG